MESVRDQRVEHHRACAHCRNTDQDQRKLRLAGALFAQRGRKRHRGRRAANRHRSACQHAKRGILPEPTRSEHPRPHRCRDDRHDAQQRDRAERDDLPGGNPHADQHDPPPQQRARSEGEARRQPCIGAEKIKRQADQQRHQRQRHAVMIRQEPSRKRSHRDHDQTREIPPPIALGRCFDVAVQIAVEIGGHRQRAFRGFARHSSYPSCRPCSGIHRAAHRACTCLRRGGPWHKAGVTEHGV